jgi:alkylation response protein AidB-like acyl-CoA dehydrogenase
MSSTTADAKKSGVVQVGSAELRDLFAEIGEGAFARERDRVHPFVAYAAIRRYRFGAYRVPRSLGGAGATLPEFFEALIDLAVVDPNVAHGIRSHFIFVDAHMAAFLRGEQSKWLDQVLAGALFGGASTELRNRNTGGLNADRMQTTLVKTPDGYRLTGTKAYATGSRYCDWVNVAAVSDADKLVTATIPVDREGVTLRDDWDGIGQQLTATDNADFDNVAVEDDEVGWGHQGEGSHVATLAQLHLTAVTAGILQAIVDDAVTVLRGRKRTFTHGAAETAADDPLLQHIVGQLATSAFTARSVVLAAAQSLDTAANAELAQPTSDPQLLQRAKLDVAKAKVAVDSLAQTAGWQLFDVAGASATRRQLNLDRHWRNARTLASHNPAIYKTRALGDHLVNQADLPASWLF